MYEAVVFSESVLFHFFLREDIYEGALHKLTGEIFGLTRLKFYETIDKRKERIIPGAFDILTRIKLCPSLADDNIAYLDRLIAKNLDAKALGNGITAEGG